MSVALVATRWRDDLFDLQALNSDATPKNIAGCSLFWGVKVRADKPLLVQAAIGVGITLLDVTTGRFRLQFPAIGKIGLLSTATYYWDVLCVSPGGQLTTPDGCSGTLTVEESIASGAVVGMTPAGGNFAFHPEITGLDGGGAAALDGYDTTLIPIPYLFVIVAGTQRQEWIADTRGAGPEAVDDVSVPADVRQTVLPDNWNAETNNVIWRRRA